MKRYLTYPMIQAILAAALFGASAPLAKLMLGNIEPVPLAAFLYLGSGLGLLLFNVLFKKHTRPGGEARISKADLPWLSGAVIAGGVAAPIILMFSLRYTPAATASLLLNFEGVATTLIAALVFKEAIGRRIWLAIGAVTVASIMLSLDFKGEWGFSLSALGVLSACVLWGIDNNFTRNISAKDPLSITTIKGLGAGTFSLVLAALLGNTFPGALVIAKAMLLGCFGYGVSIVLFILAMRNLGAARASVFFGTAPFVGTVISFLLFREKSNAQFILVIPIMILGVALLLNENHAHKHNHAAIQHEHRHSHDDAHHLHQHDDGVTVTDCIHDHVHTHEPIEHDHDHTPDIHHRHGHS